MERIIENTADGSRTIFIPELNEHYHSVKGAKTESEHIFINKGFNHIQKQEVSVFEVGFGTGLNALLTLLEAEKQTKKTLYRAVELYPLDWQTINQLSYIDSLLEEEQYAEFSRNNIEQLFEKLHTAKWGERVEITPLFTLEKIHTSLSDYLQTSHAEGKDSFQADVIYFDAFAPEKQPEMWSKEVFSGMYSITKDSGVLTTYCAKGAIRRTLKEVGYEVERLEGPPNGKREILRANKTVNTDKKI